MTSSIPPHPAHQGRHVGRRAHATLLGVRRRRLIVVAVAPLAVSAVAASAFAVVPHLTEEPTPAPPVQRVETEALDAGEVAVPQERLAPPVAAPATVGTGQPQRGRLGVVAAYQSSAGDIPAASLAAYQRAETVMHEAAAGCRLDWTILAAVGKVESDHGRADGNRVTEQGLSRPGVYGKPLNGKNGRARMRDTDAGSVDGDARWDAPAGPMSLLPSTWSVVAVDSDGDGQRNPQDVDDAALGVAVLLCDDNRDLGVKRQLRAALRAFNPTKGYAKVVIALARSYRADQLPTPVAAPTVIPTLPGDLPSEIELPGTEVSPTGLPTTDPEFTASTQPTQPQPADDTSGPASSSPSPSDSPTIPSTSPSDSSSTSPSTSESPSPSPSPSESPSGDPSDPPT